MNYTLSDNVFNDGYVRRAKPRVEILRGFDPTGVQMQTKTAEIADGVTVQSGQIISLDVNGKWVLGATTAGAKPYVAIADSTDTDVRSSGLLTALSCDGEYEIQTAWYDAGETYNEGTPLTSDSSGNIVATTWANAGGANDNVLGVVTRGGMFNLNNGFPERENMAVQTTVVAFSTKWIAKTA